MAHESQPTPISEELAKQLAENERAKHAAKTFKERVKWAAGMLKQAHAEVANVLYGQDELLDLFLTTMVAGGNVLAEGVPGTGKTLLVSNLAKVVNLAFKRVQNTPDLMPPDIIGTEFLEEGPDGKKDLKFKKGPVFTQFLMSDEINRAGPRTQSATLQPMQEYAVTVGGVTHKLNRPFMLMATQNPLEQDGTYPLPEAQEDRFMVKAMFGYTDDESEGRIIVDTTGTEEDIDELWARDEKGDNLTDPEVYQDKDQRSKVNTIFGQNDLLLMQKLARKMPLPDDVLKAIKQIVRGARPGEDGVDSYITDNVKWGPGTRAGQSLAFMAKARALLRGDTVPTVNDVLAFVQPVLEHRMQIRYDAKDPNVTFDKIRDHLTANL